MVMHGHPQFDVRAHPPGNHLHEDVSLVQAHYFGSCDARRIWPNVLRASPWLCVMTRSAHLGHPLVYVPNVSKPLQLFKLACYRLCQCDIAKAHVVCKLCPMLLDVHLVCQLTHAARSN